MKKKLFLLFFCPLLLVPYNGDAAYTPDWPSIDSRPVPAWFDECKLGIFTHWGVYSVPAYGSEWFWWTWKGEHNANYQSFVDKHYPNGTTYGDFGRMFTAIDFDAKYFSEVVKASGARYYVLTSKHHEGFTLWPSATSWNWNAMDIGPHRDLVQELSAAIRDQGLHMGLYFSLFEWFHPLFLRDQKTGSKDYPQQISYPQLLEIVNQYHPEVIWSDGDWGQTDVYWKSKEFLAWLYNDSPVKDVVAVNDRWGQGTIGKHGGYMTYQDHYDPGHLPPRKWENCLTLDRKSWGYRRDLKPLDVLTVKEIVTQLAHTIACGGNMLLNIGPDHTGRIVPIFEERLRAFGHWVEINQEAIYGSKPWIHQNDGVDIWYTSKVQNSTGMNLHRLYNRQDMFNTVIYAFILNIPRLGRINFPSIRITDKTRVSILGTHTKVPLKKSSESLMVDLSSIPWKELPSTDALVLKVEYAASSHAIPRIVDTVIKTTGDNRRRPYGRETTATRSLLSSSSSSSESNDFDDNRLAGAGGKEKQRRTKKNTVNGSNLLMELVEAEQEESD